MIDFSSEATENGTLVVRVGGSLDSDTTEYFFNCIQDEIGRGHDRIVVNCADLGFVSSLGLSAMLRARSRVVKNEGQIFFACINATLMSVLEITKLDRVFDIYPSEREAIVAIESQMN